MEVLLYFVLWAGLIFLMMRFGCGAHAMGHGHGKSDGHESSATTTRDQELRWIAPAKAVDPVCRKSVATNRAKSNVFDGEVFYFCSNKCREIFEAAPDIYLRGEGSGSGRQLEQSHA